MTLIPWTDAMSDLLPSRLSGPAFAVLASTAIISAERVLKKYGDGMVSNDLWATPVSPTFSHSIRPADAEFG